MFVYVYEYEMDNDKLIYDFFFFFLFLWSRFHVQMRNEMVHQKEGEMEFSLLTHYDNMKRISIRSQRSVFLVSKRTCAVVVLG